MTVEQAREELRSTIAALLSHASRHGVVPSAEDYAGDIDAYAAAVRAATLREVEQEVEHRAASVRGFGITDYDQGRQDALYELADWCAARREGK